MTVRQRALTRDERAAALRADPSLQPHGKPATYRNWGCRCGSCRAAQTADVQRQRAQRKERWGVVGSARPSRTSPASGPALILSSEAHAARLTVCGRARDAGDARLLMVALGLLGES